MNNNNSLNAVALSKDKVYHNAGSHQVFYGRVTDLPFHKIKNDLPALKKIQIL